MASSRQRLQSIDRERLLTRTIAIELDARHNPRAHFVVANLVIIKSQYFRLICSIIIHVCGSMICKRRLEVPGRHSGAFTRLTTTFPLYGSSNPPLPPQSIIMPKTLQLNHRRYHQKWIDFDLIDCSGCQRLSAKKFLPIVFATHQSILCRAKKKNVN